jgi:hypothetical protein
LVGTLIGSGVGSVGGAVTCLMALNLGKPVWR